MKKIFKEVDMYSEICCDLCGDVIHNHFDCPVCKNTYAGTSMYGYIEDHIELWGNSFRCEKCDSEFKILERDFMELTLELIKEGEKI